MEYYGNENIKRVETIYKTGDDIYDATSEIGFIYKSGMIANFIKELGDDYRHGLIYPFDIQGDNKSWTNDIQTLFDTVDVEGNTYYLVVISKKQRYKGLRIYKELPRVGDGGDCGIYHKYKWKENKRDHSLEMTMRTGDFEYVCNYRDSGNGSIIVKYTGCDNKHRNNVTISQIDLYNPNNYDYENAIIQWKNNMFAELKQVVHVA